MTNYRVDVHCCKCNSYVYSLPVIYTAEEWRASETALCERCTPPKVWFYGEGWMAL